MCRNSVRLADVLCHFGMLSVKQMFSQFLGFGFSVLGCADISALTDNLIFCVLKLGN